MEKRNGGDKELWSSLDKKVERKRTERVEGVEERVEERVEKRVREIRRKVERLQKEWERIWRKDEEVIRK